MEPTATLDEVEVLLGKEFKKYAGWSANVRTTEVNGRKRGKHKCINIIIWFLHYYFKILSEFTHGSVHNPGDPMNRNGLLEGTNYPFQIHANELYEARMCNKIEAKEPQGCHG